MATLRLILGDQLSHQLAALKACDKSNDWILLAEVQEEASYVKHHKRKIAFLFSAMRHFAEALTAEGYQVHYTKLDDEENSHSLLGEVKRIADLKKCDHIAVTEPGEYRLLKSMHQWEHQTGKPVEIMRDDRFLCSIDAFKEWANDGKSLLMGRFYRQMRRDTQILMHQDEPVGGQWNYDKDNRNAIPKDTSFNYPGPAQFTPDKITEEVLTLVEERFSDHFGTLKEFWHAVTAKQADEALEHFIEAGLPRFGDYQDAMQTGEPFLFHSLLSFYINAGLLDPLETCKRAEAAYEAGDAPLNAVEGFIRQILGWREFIRGVYWLKMPEYANLNYFEAKRPLPDFYWTGETKMHCMSQTIEMTSDHAYSHHIQRLMVTGNFALIAGLDVQQVCDWYLAVYGDAYEWVELPNTLGMALFADGGIVGTKPYGSSGNYINKMSNYCKSCEYKVTKKNGEDACPFNYLYWDFLARNQEKLKNNHRLARPYSTYGRFDDSKKKIIQQDAERFLSSLKSNY